MGPGGVARLGDHARHRQPRRGRARRRPRLRGQGALERPHRRPGPGAPIAALPARTALASCSKDYRFYEGLGQLDGGLFITAQSGDDLAFVHSSWDQGIESWRFRLPTTESAEPAIAHTILDRALFRAGETVSMKHVIRRPVPRGLGPVAPGSGRAGLVIRHLGSDEKYELALTWDAGGIAEGAWPIPKSAKLGTYEVIMRGPARGDSHPSSPPGGSRSRSFACRS